MQNLKRIVMATVTVGAGALVSQSAMAGMLWDNDDLEQVPEIDKLHPKDQRGAASPYQIDTRLLP